MPLRAEEARVLASLIEKAATVPESYPLTLNALRQACNQTSNRDPVVHYDDRTVEAALASLKADGLVRFVHPSHGGRTIRYRHVADERWQLAPEEVAVLAVLVLRGHQTAAEVRARAERMLTADGPTVDDALDRLAAREPEPFAVRLARSPGEREARWAHLLTGEVVAPTPGVSVTDPADAAAPTPARRSAPADDGGALAAEVAELRRRLDRLEALLGVEDDPAPGDQPG